MRTRVTQTIIAFSIVDAEMQKKLALGPRAVVGLTSRHANLLGAGVCFSRGGARFLSPLIIVPHGVQKSHCLFGGLQAASSSAGFGMGFIGYLGYLVGRASRLH